jgi:hypothetical protein
MEGTSQEQTITGHRKQSTTITPIGGHHSLEHSTSVSTHLTSTFQMEGTSQEQTTIGQRTTAQIGRNEVNITENPGGQTTQITASPQISGKHLPNEPHGVQADNRDESTQMPSQDILQAGIDHGTQMPSQQIQPVDNPKNETPTIIMDITRAIVITNTDQRVSLSTPHTSNVHTGLTPIVVITPSTPQKQTNTNEKRSSKRETSPIHNHSDQLTEGTLPEEINTVVDLEELKSHTIQKSSKMDGAKYIPNFAFK